MSCVVTINMQPLEVHACDERELPNGYSLAKRKQRLASEILSALVTNNKREYNKRWSKAKYDADPMEYNRRRLLRQLNDKTIIAPRHATIIKYNLRWDPATDAWH